MRNKSLLIIGICVGLASCAKRECVFLEGTITAISPKKHHEKDAGTVYVRHPKDKHDDTNPASRYKNQRQYPQRGMKEDRSNGC